MTIDANTAVVLVHLFTLTNTALLVYQAVRLQQVHALANGAKDAAVEAAVQAAALSHSTPPNAASSPQS